MAQWGQGYQYPLQTGFNPQQFQQQGFPQSAGGIPPQPTGFPGQQSRPAGFQQAQPTGFPGIVQGGYQQPQSSGFAPQPTGFQLQQTGFQAGGYQQQQRPPPPPVPPIPTQYQQQQNAPPQPSFLSGPPPQVNRFLNSSPGPSLTAQPTGFSGGGLRPLVAQPTGFIDPRLQMMSSQFLPANPTAPYTAGGAPQFQLQPQGGVSLQQSFQQHNQSRGTIAPKVPWALSKGEKKSYDQIFRAWDHRGEGFISGQTALEVFGQSGLDKNDLAQIWSLADVDNRGKLNLPEFYVAMGLIYRRLNGNEIPDALPHEMVPPSAKDLDDSVDFLKRVLQNDSRARSPSNFDSSSPISKLKERSFNSTSAPGAGGRQDATVYKHKDESPPGGFYQSSRRHFDRSTVKTQSDRDSPASDLDDMKRQLENAAKMLDRNAAKTEEDDVLDREMSDVRYRVKRLQEDLEYVSRGPRSVSKDEERRRLERELMGLLHDKLPDLERRIKDREERKKREQREWDRARDKRNERFGRFGDRDSEDRYGSSRNERDEDRYRSYDRDRDFDRERDRDWDRDRTRDREYERDSPYSRDRDREYERPRSPASRSPAPPPPAPAPPSTTLAKPTPPPVPSVSPAPSTKNMTPEERKAFIQAEAQRRMQARMAALGVVSSSSPAPKLDTSVEDRLAKEKQEAEEKARAAEKEAEERARLRRERLEGEKALKEGVASPVKAEPPAPPPTVRKQPPPPTRSALKAAPPPPKSRGAPAPPPPRRAPAPRAPVSRAPAVAPPPPAPVVVPQAPAEPEVDPHEQELKAREAALKKAREERLERLRRLEEEEEEATRKLEEEYKARRAQRTRPVEVETPAPPPAPPVPVPPAPAPVVRSTPAPPAPAPPAPAPPAEKNKNNPFSRLMREGSSSSATTTPSTPTNGSTNPFFKSQTPPTAPPPPVERTPPTPQAPVRSPSVPPPSKSPAPAAVKTSYHTAPGESDEDWDDVQEREDDDSSEDELDSSRDSRNKLAQQLFGSILPPSRPQSAAPPTPVTPTAPPTAPPPSTSAPPVFAEASVPDAPAPPPPPPPPGPPPPPAVAVAAPAPAPSGDRSALLSAIQGGARLKKAVTNDRSGTALSGRILGDAAPPPHINAAPTSAPSPPQAILTLPIDGDSSSSRSNHRDSVDWYAGLAADGGSRQSEGDVLEKMPSMPEVPEEHEYADIPHIQVEDTHTGGPMDDIDLSVEYRVRALYDYEGEISFTENAVLKAHPSKSGGDWWYGSTVRDGKSGLFPQTYVQRYESDHAIALYSYQSTGPEQLSFEEEDNLTIVDRSDADWWKAERDGMVYIVPAAYLQVVEGDTFLTPWNALRQQEREIQQPGIGDIQNGDVSPPTVQVTLSANHDDAGTDEGDIGSDTDDSDSESWATASESYDSDEGEDTNVTEEERKTEREARAVERERVLEAAGLIIKAEKNPPPRPVHARSFRKRRAPPAIPQRASTAASNSHRRPHRQQKSLPPVPEPEPNEQSFRLDDAYERYEAYKKSHGNLNRLSVASVETSPSLSSPTLSGPITRSPSIETSESRTHSILHFFGLKSPSHETETRPMPVISGPISGPILGPLSATVSREPTPNPADTGPAFGSSWASLVDRSVVDEMPTKERRRQEAIFEFIATEAAYVRDLQLIVEVFYRGLLPHLDEKAATVIFANVEDILLTNTTFLSCLEERQKECRLYIDKIGDILKDNMAQMGIYREYCVNQAAAIKVLQSLRESNPDLAAHLQRLRDDPAVRSLDLSSYLLVPMQRATRYPLLIKQVLHYSEMEDDRRQIQRALEMSEKILQHINETMREQEGKERLGAISKNLWIGQGRLDLTADTRNMGPRKLLKEGILLKAKSGRKLRAFLCTDIMVLTDDISHSLYDLPIPLSEVRVKPGSKDDTSFQIVRPYPRGGDTTRLRATSPRDCQSWMEAIEDACRKCRAAEKQVDKVMS